MRRLSPQRLFSSRKTLSLTLIIMVASIFSLTVAYATLSTVLNISGSTEVAASNWDIHLDNVIVRTGSVSANAPSISGNNNLSFTANLTTPGDYYEFSVDVVNDGSIDAMIDSIIKTPELTAEQAKFFKYEVTYQNGASIATKQTLRKGTRTPIIVRIEYRKDLTAADLPSESTNLSLKLTLVYVQSDGTGTSISNNGVATDLEKPTCTLSVSGSRPYSEWYITNPTISILTTPGYSEITDVHIQNNQASDLDAINFDNNTSKTQTTDTSGTIWYGYAKDEMGNVVECRTASLKVDTTPPNSPTGGSISVSGSNTTATLGATSLPADSLSGTKEVRYYVIKNSSSIPSNTSSNFITSRSFSRACGTTYHAYAIAVDNAGNKSEVYKIGTTSDPASSYSAYGTCSKSCGGGTQTRTNTCPLVTTGLSTSCNTQACCSSSAVYFVDGSSCTASCGGGTRNQLAYSQYDGSRCASYDKSYGGSSCNTFDCCSSVSYTSGTICSCTAGTYNLLAYSTYTGARCESRDTSSGGASCSTTAYVFTDFGTSTGACQKFALQYTGSSNYTTGNISVCSGSSTVSSCVPASSSTCSQLGSNYFYLRNCKTY